jgi:MFS family permease
MSWKALTKTEIRKATPVFIANLFFSVHYAALIYINSSFLEQYFSAKFVSILFFLGALGNAFLFYFAPHLLRRFGNRALFFIFVLIDMCATGGLALTHNPYLVGLFFLLFESISIMVYFCLDIFLVDASLEENTGEMRGIDLTIANSAIALGPALVAYFVIEGNFSRLYGISALLLLPLLVLAFFSFKSFRDGRVHPKEGEFMTAIKIWFKNRNAFHITWSRFMLEFFYSFMIIYIPVYLHKTIGFTWPQIGLIFTIMLLPFVLLQLPAGEAADRFLGEKKLLIIGFIFCGISVLFMPFIGLNLAYWTLALFASRIGAALVEVMTDTYFFKLVDKHDTGLISIFRLARPLGIMAGSVTGILLLSHLPLQMIFFLLSAISLLGILQSARIRDII